MNEYVTDERDDAYGLRSYITLKQEVADVAREALRWAGGAGGEPANSELERALRDLLVKLAEDRFNLVVVGQFKRGKSSLMNALMGRDLLPTGLLPLTSAITTLRYGSRERALLQRTGWTIEQEIPLRELADYVTEQGNPNNEKGLIEARVELPARFLRRGLFFVDTPGAGSASESATATTHAFLPQADAIIFVTSVEAPMSEVEIAFLETIRAFAREVFVVVNKMDQVDALNGEPDDERERILGFIREHVSQALGVTDVPLYPVSARLGLAAQRQHNTEALQRSGIPALERALVDYLAREQGRVFLARALDHLDGALAQASPSAQRDASGDISRLRERVAALRAELASASATPEAPRATAPAVVQTPTIASVVETLNQPAPSAERPASATHAPSSSHAGRCPICAALSDALFALFTRWQYALASSDEARQAFAATSGFCAYHTWQFERIAAPQTISEGYAPLIARLEVELRAALDGAHQTASQPHDLAADLAEQVARLMPRTENCPACHALEEARARQVEELVSRLSALPAGEATPARALCLPHLRDALAAASAPPAPVAISLLREQIQRLEDLADDLRSYLLKRAALRRSLLTSEEDSAWRRALVSLVGERDAGLPL